MDGHDVVMLRCRSIRARASPRNRPPLWRARHGGGWAFSEKRFFFEKKNQKTFIVGRPAVTGDGGSLKKVFLLLFLQKKKFLSLT
ncbi:hypothetical protein NON00_22920 [Roseomonas sp. GC11]|uniref:hypothetical protein n=1 Tax=Roseomonas sp. GC11 TaxID=2950546 RepID=UPI00210EAE6E|nr:hypothetical protein [Roseomonas sp. GC11]MCQ4162762.1 hypothetical protein [Roseomonas sp. GC11]